MRGLCDIGAYLLEGILELVYPTCCAGCELPGTLICDDCMRALDASHAQVSTVAGLGAVRSRSALERPISRIITVYKDGGERRLAEPLGALLAGTGAESLEWADALTWIPASRRAVARRGFDHAGAIARAVGDAAGMPPTALLAPTGVRDQRGLDRRERGRNVRGAFTLRAREPVPSRVVLLDDVMTTGATLASAAACLRAGGVRDVRALTLAVKL